MPRNAEALWTLTVRAADALLRDAFPDGTEADLVQDLRAARDLAWETVQPGEDGATAIGYAALSWMVAPQGWLCLAPMAAAPGMQGRGIGTELVARALAWATEKDAHVVVLGDPGWYGARGFSLDRAARLNSPYPISHTLLAGPGTDAPEQALIYPPAFSAPA
ncbi:GNAT family N-acetyltransferase [Pukyongiella litopenaei]|uniref:GNAT family N-acetyltransferase n=1 Tax=Pukyongiella litopenaei TaxID=2605946 RepID=UPI001FCE79FA|nr:N-acetyltransferase [Pukyongiella litopenaei]